VHIENDKLKTGDNLNVFLQFEIKQPSKIRLEYELGFQSKSGKPSVKVFQINEKEYNPGSCSLTVRHTIQNLTTRKIYSGKHSFRLIVNGKRLEQHVFLVC